MNEVVYTFKAGHTWLLADGNDNGSLDGTDFALDLVGTHNIAVTDFTSTAFVTAGTDGDDSISGTEGDDVIFGLAGNDQLFGLGGNDELDGGAGNDLLDGGAGFDNLFGGDGNDTLDLRNSDFGGNAEGGAGDDLLLGSDVGSVTLRGEQGNDTLRAGAAGDAALVGGDGDDRLEGGAGDDQFIGAWGPINSGSVLRGPLLQDSRTSSLISRTGWKRSTSGVADWRPAISPSRMTGFLRSSLRLPAESRCRALPGKSPQTLISSLGDLGSRRPRAGLRLALSVAQSGSVGRSGIGTVCSPHSQGARVAPFSLPVARIAFPGCQLSPAQEAIRALLGADGWSGLSRYVGSIAYQGPDGDAQGGAEAAL